MDSVSFNKSDLENASFMNSTITKLTLDKTITDNVDFTDISLNVEENSNTRCKSDSDTDVKSIKADIYNVVQEILKDSGLDTNDIKTKIDIYKQLIEKAKTTITYKRNEVIDVQNIEAWLKHTLKL